MVQGITGFRPYVSAVPSVVQQERVNQIKLERNEVSDDLRNGKISDMQAMSERAQLDSKLTDAKTAPASSNKNVEVVGVDRTPRTEKTDDVKNTQSASVTAVNNQQKGKELSYAEKQRIVSNQMNQMAINNQVLHGLVAI